MSARAFVAALGVACTAAAPFKTAVLSNGVEMPTVAAGVWQYTEAEAEASVRAALDVGLVAIDTAYDYGNQRGVARALKGVKRSDFFLITKVPGCGIQNISAQRCEEDTAARIADDLDQLDLEVLDLVLIHFPPCLASDKSECSAKKNSCTTSGSCDAVKAQWRAMTAAYKAKKLRAIGVSNYCRACFACLADEEVKPMVNQVHYQLGMGKDPQGFASYASSQGIVLQAWSPFGKGGHGSDDVLKGPLTSAIANKHNRTTAQVALKWIVSHGVAVAMKSSTKEHLKENNDLFDFELDAQDMAKLDAANFAADNTPSFFCDDKADEILI
jgi:diketogulonate reductase-like aldo/keto reductase